MELFTMHVTLQHYSTLDSTKYHFTRTHRLQAAESQREKHRTNSFLSTGSVVDT
jgi:hypothetical protein